MSSFVHQKPKAKSSRRRNGTSSAKLRKYKIAALAFSSVAMISVIGWVTTAAQVSALDNSLSLQELKQGELENEIDKLESRIKRMDGEKFQLNKEIENLNHKLSEIMKDRIPGLHLLELDKTVQLKQDYVKTTSFTLTGNRNEKRYEYHMVLQNEQNRPLSPDVSIRLFNKVGMQLGESVIRSGIADNTDTILAAGETRSFNGQVMLDSNETPSYFIVYSN